jgi:multiple sugar transport system permease protein
VSGLGRSLMRVRSPLLGFALVLPSLVLILALIAYPLVFSLVLSFGKVGANFRHYQFVGLGNYVSVFTDPENWHALLVTLEFAAAVTLAVTLVALGGALLLNFEVRGRALFRSLLLVPWAIPPIANGVIWLSIFNKNYGALNGLLFQLGIKTAYTLAWSDNPGLAMASVLIAQVWKWSPFITLMLLAALQSIPEDLYHAARIDGAGIWRRFASITLPLLMPTMLLLTLLNVVWAANAFDLIFALTRGGPGDATKVVAYYIWIRTFSATADFGGGAALSYVVLLICVLVTFAYARAAKRQRVDY